MLLHGDLTTALASQVEHGKQPATPLAQPGHRALPATHTEQKPDAMVLAAHATTTTPPITPGMGMKNPPPTPPPPPKPPTPPPPPPAPP